MPNPNPSPFSSQIVLVTGSSRGLGLAIARAFAAEGARVVINYLKSKEAAEAAAAELGAANAVAIQADVTDAAQVRALFAAAQRHHNGSPITVVVNNALADFSFNGDAGRETIETISWRAFDAQLRGSLQGALNTTQAALAGFKAAGCGRIVHIGTNLFQNPVVPYHDYTAAKGALLAFTRTSAKELGRYGVTVNMVAGGLLRVTDASRGTPESVFEAVAAQTPLRRVCTPEDLTGAVLFFAGQGASCVTGQQICVDGGLVMV